MMRSVLAGAVGAVLLAGFVGGAFAQDPLAVVDARRAALKQAGGAMKTLADHLKEGKGTPADVEKSVAVLRDVAGKIDGWWPKGTAVGVGNSEALPAIWEKPDEFKQKAEAFKTAVAGVPADAGDKAAFGKQLGAVGASCKGCHMAFRED